MRNQVIYTNIDPAIVWGCLGLEMLEDYGRLLYLLLESFFRRFQGIMMYYVNVGWTLFVKLFVNIIC